MRVPSCFETHRSAVRVWKHLCSLARKSGLPDLRLLKRPISGKPEIGCDAPQHEGRSGRCILAKRLNAGFGEPNGVRVLGPNEEPTYECRERAPRRAPCFRPVLYRELRNSSV